MPAIIHCVRHAQGFHNLGHQFHTLPDPKLTPVGIEQCKDTKDKIWKDQNDLSLITASPLSRTLNTAVLIFGDALSSNGKTMDKILAIPDTQETSDFPCDTGSDADVLRQICAEHKWPVDLDLVRDGWNVKVLGGPYEPSSKAIKARARSARRFLREKVKELEAAGDDDVQIALVTHGGYLHYFTEDWEDSDKLHGTGWQNCETRSYTFEHGDNDPHAHLVETIESRKRRGLDYPMFPKDKQREFFEKCMEQWKDLGLDYATVESEDEDVQHNTSSMDRKPEVDVKA